MRRFLRHIPSDTSYEDTKHLDLTIKTQAFYYIPRVDGAATFKPCDSRQRSGPVSTIHSTEEGNIRTLYYRSIPGAHHKRGRGRLSHRYQHKHNKILVYIIPRSGTRVIELKTVIDCEIY